METSLGNNLVAAKGLIKRKIALATVLFSEEFMAVKRGGLVELDR